MKERIDVLMTRLSANMRMPTTFSMMTKRGCCSRHISVKWIVCRFFESPSGSSWRYRLKPETPWHGGPPMTTSTFSGSGSAARLACTYAWTSASATSSSRTHRSAPPGERQRYSMRWSTPRTSTTSCAPFAAAVALPPFFLGAKLPSAMAAHLEQTRRKTSTSRWKTLQSGWLSRYVSTSSFDHSQHQRVLRRAPPAHSASSTKERPPLAE
mmetsp:Transcript_34009/g.109215  ORF Transcript_34009/g.109215 Transcript_34009/m.109215 type:complete len:211 (-) Transcript_34009:1806-2438(-)